MKRIYMVFKKVTDLQDIPKVEDKLPLNMLCYVSNGTTSTCITYEKLIENLKRDLNLN